MLTIVTLAAAAQTNLPKVSYIKPLDLWLITCLLFVFAALITIAYINFMYGDGLIDNNDNKQSKSQYGNHDDQMVKINLTEDAEDGQNNADGEKNRMTRSGKRNKTLCIARVAFPCICVVFNIVYWSYYLNQSMNPGLSN